MTHPAPSVSDPKIIIALDDEQKESVHRLVTQLNPALCRLKVGSILFTRYGPSLVEELMQRGFDIFLDLKFHDIPKTVAGAVAGAAALGVWMTNVHIQGGRAMLEAARESIERSHHKPLLLGVTVLTSLDQTDLQWWGVHEAIPTLVERMAHLAKSVGLDGVICSVAEVALLRARLPADFLLVSPGIRLPEDSHNDQKRVLTPEAALQAGVNYLVIGRSITRAQDPLQTLQRIHAELIARR
ncbi:MAG: orotidine 5'-phosphate decarboxylase [Coxiella sp. RIFCSPHIGHO2_12_FULL_44_14]|nr:MAG: orotidine 5'-phosphate decarboxylase [Coxiella sp. RIFCSPHIGHO2_12_FULL_44_14]